MTRIDDVHVDPSATQLGPAGTRSELKSIPPDEQAEPPRTEQAPADSDSQKQVGWAGISSSRGSGFTSTGTNAPAIGIELPEGVETSKNWEQRYQHRELLGVGGMGEVELYQDAWVGREVALKTLLPKRTTSDSYRRRFYQEMRVQGQLEHPSIVPVYDFGIDPRGRPYFTMRRVRGPTLKQILGGLANGETTWVVQYSRRKLLTSFVNVCLAVHYAHTRGVLHRDLKPSNIMLGEFGEVYVLDWGIAKVAAAAGKEGRALTDAGAVVGTTAYMAPEQLLGSDTLDARADVYALGMILFELLTLRPFHQNREKAEITLETLRGVDARPSLFVNDVPPELDAICTLSTLLDRTQRLASVQEMANAIERYLDGDRDLERRRQAAATHADKAAQAAARVTAPNATAGNSEGARSEAMREVVTALAFDPSNARAVQTLVELMVKVPETMPVEVEADMRKADEKTRLEGAKMALLSFLCLLAFVPVALVMGIRNWTMSFIWLFATIIGALYAWWVQFSRSLDTRHNYTLALFAGISVAMGSGILGPFMMVPTSAAITTILFLTVARRHERAVLTLLGALSFVLPWVAEAIHLVPPSMLFEEGRVVLFARVFELPSRVTLILLIYAGLAWIIAPAILVGRLRDALSRAEQLLFLHSWHLRRLVPEDSHEPGLTTPSAPA